VLIAVVPETAAAEAIEFRNSVEEERGLFRKDLLGAKQIGTVELNRLRPANSGDTPRPARRRRRPSGGR
jgi:hypothetical protein